ncbi:MAG: glycosyltransferase family 4 protein [Candidatus Micrarchaeota archaeon]|nr:glycosyltransferase family 4 protein [Candidatus Micrarchaeota archaeon]MDE1834144.1 glycosyltransferase family 4 protein [Candidatus Micrarchaeota archaeon]MDE1859529.1 glycosyltransferase family 4 protein [Candidatus Micrarchaeota archaeon]
MKLAMINIVKPAKGSGDGITEYTYKLYKEIRKTNKVDLVYSLPEAIRNNISGLVSANLKMRGTLQMMSCDYDILHITNQEVGFASKLLSKRCDTPVVTTVHDISRFQKGLQRGVLQRTYNRMVKAYVADAIHNSDFLIFDSQLTMDEVKKKFYIGKNGRVVNIGIDSSFMTRPKTKRTDSKKFTVGYIGSFAYHKNVMLLLEAANIIEDGYAFNIYGSGVEAKRLEEYKELNKLNSVKFMGFAPEERKVEIYDSFDAFVFPSLYEGFGLPILEAQARGLPVIVYKKGKVSEEIKKYCFEAEDAVHMASIIDDIRENGYDDKLRRKATAYARSFTWRKCAEETLKVYDEIVN